jgi:hypothetical protein
VSFDVLFEFLFFFSIQFDEDECVALGKTECEILFFSFFFLLFSLIEFYFVKKWLILINIVKQTFFLTYIDMQNKRRWENTNFQKIIFVFVSILPGEEMKYLLSFLVMLNGKMDRWK